ncbi:hypothetical protein chiPu_0032245 [Chiloscyllium punctatum]|uniref:Uncharacterized protein n=1 Tax=Chiloscyllium punctatum TaxID=137246 RepID=A0A401TZP1_CHIPU|nr:hypothetical protein [Chiloscyllium punctatum]
MLSQVEVKVAEEEEEEGSLPVGVGVGVNGGSPGDPSSPSHLQQDPYPSFSEQLRIAMAQSSKEQEDLERRWREEEEELQRILQLSLTDK